jgi:hypothetical protein
VLIAQLSDVHVGGSRYRESFLCTAIEEINAAEPDLVVIAGDLTDEGYPDQYPLAREELAALACRHVVRVPGNHDARNVGYLHYEDTFGARDSRERLDCDGEGFQNPGSLGHAWRLRWFRGSRAREYQIALGLATHQLKVHRTDVLALPALCSRRWEHRCMVLPSPISPSRLCWLLVSGPGSEFAEDTSSWSFCGISWSCSGGNSRALRYVPPIAPSLPR